MCERKKYLLKESQSYNKAFSFGFLGRGPLFQYLSNIGDFHTTSRIFFVIPANVFPFFPAGSGIRSQGKVRSTLRT
jgi:hypothetical protein